ncbi:hypothetical protein HD806DRAFT_533977 [Xylariaceae sp. AK1471]|nr:hypothetical protein HD806DRAFT_533977 [Xylariaceae sp. AK1471]
MTGNESDGSKRYEVAIPRKGLAQRHLEEYLKLELSLDDIKYKETVINDNYTILLPKKLTTRQQQDIDLCLRTKSETAEAFLEAYRTAKKGHPPQQGQEQASG